MLWDGKAMGEMGVQLRVREFPYEGRTVPYTSRYPEQSSFLPTTELWSAKKRRSEISKIRYLIVPSVVMSVSKTREEEQNQGSAADQATLTTIAKALISRITFDPKEMPEAIADSARSRDWKKMFRAYLTVHVPKVLDGMSLDGTSLGLSNDIQLMRTPPPAGDTSGFQTFLKENGLEEFVPKIKEYPTDCDLSPTRMLAETGERRGIRTERHLSSANPDDKGRESTFAYRLQGRRPSGLSLRVNNPYRKEQRTTLRETQASKVIVDPVYGEQCIAGFALLSRPVLSSGSPKVLSSQSRKPELIEKGKEILNQLQASIDKEVRLKDPQWLQNGEESTTELFSAKLDESIQKLSAYSFSEGWSVKPSKMVYDAAWQFRKPGSEITRHFSFPSVDSFYGIGDDNRDV
ncbi:hypothetical protein DB88DRAFT_542928 [Papiliotrema laurentii]|uniref:Uncharacterized protein n=1 Tax=Papiliotrema laurentii TaxID=5418 RepID=A0AAD9CTU8_PAPLA|nr:hypothetical protein DB88DRAFT_542928 [Papiliotrema laurentii]